MQTHIHNLSTHLSSISDMKIKEITDSLAGTAALLELAFFTGTAEYLAAVVDRYPALFVETPQFRSMEGVSHGRITYRLVLHVLDAAAGHSAERRNQSIDIGEGLALTLLTQLSLAPSIVAVENISIRPSMLKLTGHGDVSVTAVADIVCDF